MKKQSLILLAAAALTLPSQGALVAYWNFNGLSATTGEPPSNANQTSYTPTIGSASLTLDGWTSRGGSTAPHGISNFTGSTVNAISPDVAGQALALQGGTTSGSTPNNGASLVMSFRMTDMEDLVITFATRRTPSGFNNNQVAYSTNGVDYTDFGSPYNPTTTTTFDRLTFDFSGITALNNQATAYVRIIFGGATDYQGNNRIDNLQINAVPEPSLGLLGSLGVLGLLRRRR